MSVSSARLLVALLFVTGCSSPATQMIVTIDAEPGVRMDSARLHVVVLGGVGRTTAPTASRFDRVLTPGDADPTYPITIGLAPLDGDVGRSYTVTATAQTATGGFVGQVRIVGGYVEGETLRVRITLEDACRAVTCAAEETCRAGVCVAARIDSDVDAGVSSADAGPADAAFADADAGASDAEMRADSGVGWGRCLGAVCDEIAEVEAGFQVTCVRVQPSGSVYCWGANESGQLGRGTITPFELIPSLVPLPGPASELDLGANHACAVVAGRAYCWGRGDFGKLGHGSEASSSTPVLVADIADFQSVSCGVAHTCGLKADGYVVCWGGNGWGVLGDGTSTSRLRPVFATVTGGVLDVQAGATSTVMNRSDVVPLGTGKISGREATTTQPIVQLPSEWCDTGTRPTGVAYNGFATTYFVASDGRVYVQGNNDFGVRANGTTTAPTGTCWTTRAMVAAVDTIVTGGEANYAFAKLRDRTWVAWGANENGQLGLGRVSTAELLPQVLTLPSDTSRVATGSVHACALSTAGELRCWGANAKGELGNRSVADSLLTFHRENRSKGIDIGKWS